MTPNDLRAHKRAVKELTQIPSFTPVKKNALPPPFSRYKSKRLHSTGFLDLGANYCAIFFWRDGQVLTDRAFFGHLFLRTAGGRLYPVFEFHWHPSHKPIHCKLPCSTDQDYTDRTLPGAPELALTTSSTLDPSDHDDRTRLIEAFCKASGVQMRMPPQDPNSMSLFS